LGLFNKYNPPQILLSKSRNNNIHNFYQFFFSVKYFFKKHTGFFLQKKIRLIVFNNFRNLFPFVAVVLQISSLGYLSWYTRLPNLWKPHRRPHLQVRNSLVHQIFLLHSSFLGWSVQLDERPLVLESSDLKWFYLHPRPCPDDVLSKIIMRRKKAKHS
jgi:hypothetical protein